MKILSEVLSETLGYDPGRGRSIEIIGDIAILKLPIETEGLEKIIAKKIVERIPRIRTVYKQLKPTSGMYRIRELQLIYGDPKTIIIHKENGYLLKIDVQRVFFTPKLQGEHLRIAQLSDEGETVFNMFSGVGGFSIAIAMLSKPRIVYSSDINPYAIKIHRENCRLNRVGHIIDVICIDAKDLALLLKERCDRVIMPLPMLAREYLRYAVPCLRDSGGWLHIYDFIKGVNKSIAARYALNVYENLIRSLASDILELSSRCVGSIAPRTYRVVIDAYIIP